ncbi:MAG: formylglycine-generating enzyme family protein [Microcystis viridis Mv_BB_P_19951000_S69]|uniref:Formylglycine-generating enzyme family protein n=1 Tax=Microcystis viridis Mv_BB_P_19951000_S68D TaxID=2486270 RepID=A0A552I8I9_MICVR|nr:MAG: formylglycine-generating enzyme family protein [Microcystis viridis Mv_BB_P_19951000_S69]TRU79224.1 MAG: formylglycine-generating enzyme family protein [Microcystis viridis Mv_BB_P_19951000_S68]TRU79800.1 MAG: formylglycine-generating enzyme family protein [Microcystis viridis Mv_BB_P_19951000_S68D]TRU90393.1 MAG: formylglycine-generating enzyme family protein [Microcystis viridis Mv_BB_P_19951000_S69D]
MEGKKAIWWEDEREMAELIWCAAYLDRIIAPWSLEQPEHSESTPSNDKEDNRSSGSGEETPPPGAIESTIPVVHPENIDRPTQTSQKRDSVESDRSSPVRVPDPFPIPEPAAISKAILPLARRVPGLRADELDIEVTVERTAEAGGLPILAFRPPLERWLEVHLLIDRSPPMEFWGDLAGGMTTLFRWQGFFRDVRVWWFETGENEARLLSGAGQIERNPRSLVAPSGNRLFIVLTDTLGKAWRSGAAFATLADLGKEHPVTIAHIFPQQLWQRTALEGAILRPLIAPGPAAANATLQVGERLRTKQILYRFPIFNLSPAHFATWAKFIAGSGGNSIQGVLMGATTAGVDMGETGEEEAAAIGAESPEELLRGFLIDASPLARELAKVLAAVPLIPPVMRLAQRRFLPDSKHWHLAEVFFSGLVQKSIFSPEGATVTDAWYDFYPGIRQLLLADSANRRTIDIWRGIGDYIRDHYGEFRDFQALIPNPQGSLEDAVSDRSLYFAEVDAAVLRTWGGEYADIAQNIEESVRQRKQEILTPEELLKFPFETLYVDKRGEITKREPLEACYYQEPLGEGIEPLTMVAIPGGAFLMGSPGEKDDDKDQKPQHPVSVSAFYLSQTPITRAQWRFVANLPREGKDLDPDPAEFKESDNNPVESVTWYDAIEFCARLSRHTGKNYRLPSEAEWEYACRAGTITPFHFGETITGELANYDSSRVYQQEKAKKSLGKTRPVRSYPPNAFGLYDMHGNVWEWCLDPWHGDYQGAPPTDGSVWDEKNNNNRYQNILNSINELLTDSRSCVVRGGSWNFFPYFCRSAYRGRNNPDFRSYYFGFRVVCGAGRTL